MFYQQIQAQFACLAKQLASKCMFACEVMIVGEHSAMCVHMWTSERGGQGSSEYEKATQADSRYGLGAGRDMAHRFQKDVLTESKLGRRRVSQRVQLFEDPANPNRCFDGEMVREHSARWP